MSAGPTISISPLTRGSSSSRISCGAVNPLARLTSSSWKPLDVLFRSSGAVFPPPLHSLHFHVSSSLSSIFTAAAAVCRVPHNSPTDLLTSSSTANNMTIKATPTIDSGCLIVNDKVVLTGVPSNITISPMPSGSAFIGATSTITSPRHVFGLGSFEGFDFLSLFRFKIWWMIPRVGKSSCEVPLETQFLLLEVPKEAPVFLADDTTKATVAHGDNDTFYVLFLPVLDGMFRASLQGTGLGNELQFCVESGDADVETSQVLEALFLNSGDNPYELIRNSVKILEKHKGTFHHIDNKKVPAHLDWFGWCTWDAFYHAVNPQGIKEGLQSFLEGGCSPKFLIIDDGWQDTFNEFCKEGVQPYDGTQFATRLVDIKENHKFRSLGSEDYDTFPEFISFVKQRYGIKYVYVWHAVVGYWGGLLPSSKRLKKYNPNIVYPVQSPGNVGNLRDIAMDSMEKYGIGIIDPDKIYDFYNDQHDYLASIGVDGVKVDVQNVVETMGAGFGGRVNLTRKFQVALEESCERNFKQNNLICCMSLNTDYFFSSKKGAAARASEDFMPKEPTLQTLHIASVAFNSLLLGEIVVPDWDMFHSKHETADFHGAARAVGGCPVYVSDKPGMHDFNVLRKLVLPDGTILRARFSGRPTRDCLFKDPVMDGKSLMKIWNLNKLSGVVGIFNCQGAGTWPLEEATRETLASELIVGHVTPTDVEFIDEIAGGSWSGDCAIYAFNSGSLSLVPKKGKLEVSLSVLTFDLFTMSPVKDFGESIRFAPIGLLDMYNSGGALEALSSLSGSSSECILKIKARGCGRFGAYSNIKPRYCRVDMKDEEFTYNPEDGFLIVELKGECKLKEIEIVY